jgi:hypothetical protein
LFGTGFLIIARLFPAKSIMRKYIIISAFGFALFFTTNQAIVLTFLPFPPYGLVAASFTGIASYLVMIGIYSSAISMAQDSKLRQVIRKVTSNQISFLENIGLSETEDTISRRVLEITTRYEQELKNATVIEPTYSKDDMQKYIQEVLAEVKIQRFPSHKFHQPQLIEEWWKSYLNDLEEMNCKSEETSTSIQLDRTVNDVSFLSGYMGTRNLNEYYFEVMSGKQLFFPILIERFEITRNISNISETNSFRHPEPVIYETMVYYDNNILSDLRNLKIESKKIKFQCTSKNGSSTGYLEIDFEGYWIFLNDVPTGQHIISLKKSTNTSSYLNYKLLVH